VGCLLLENVFDFCPLISPLRNCSFILFQCQKDKKTACCGRYTPVVHPLAFPQTYPGKDKCQQKWIAAMQLNKAAKLSGKKHEPPNDFSDRQLRRWHAKHYPGKVLRDNLLSRYQVLQWCNTCRELYCVRCREAYGNQPTKDGSAWGGWRVGQPPSVRWEDSAPKKKPSSSSDATIVADDVENKHDTDPESGVFELSQPRQSHKRLTASGKVRKKNQRNSVAFASMSCPRYIYVLFRSLNRVRCVVHFLWLSIQYAKQFCHCFVFRDPKIVCFSLRARTYIAALLRCRLFYSTELLLYLFSFKYL